MFIGAEEEQLGNVLKKIRKKAKKLARPVTRVVKKATSKGPLKKIKKVLRKIGAAQAGLVTGGLVKAKALGIKSKSGQRIYKTAGKVTKIAAAAIAAVYVAPALGAGIAKGGTALLGGLKFVGGKLVSAPKAVYDALAGSGKDPNTASVEDVLQAAVGTGYLTEEQLREAERQALAGRPIQAGGFLNDPTVMLIVGGGVLAGVFLLTQGKKK